MKIRKLVLASLFVAMSVIGAHFNLTSSIALDSFPAFLGASLLGPIYGFALGFLGHMVTALLSGFPSGLVIHFLLGLIMGLTMFVFARVRGREPNLRQKLLSNILAWILNVPVALSVVWPFLGSQIVLALLIPLSLATLVNLLIAEMLFAALPISLKSETPLWKA